MKGFLHKLKKKWIWGLGATVLFVALFFGVFSGKIMNNIQAADSPYSVLYGNGDIQSDQSGNYTLCRQQDTLSFLGRQNIHDTNIVWSVSQDSVNPVIEIVGAAADGTFTGRTLNMTAKSAGTATVEVHAELDNKDQVTFVILVRVGFTINRGLYKDDSKGIWMQELYPNPLQPTDPDYKIGKYSIILNEGSQWELGTGLDGTAASNAKLNLVYGDATKHVMWDSGNKNVAVVENGKLVAKGGGHTVLTAIPTTESDGNPDSIDVYVNPKVEINGNEFLADKTVSGSSPVTIDNRTEIKLPNLEFLQGDSNDTITNRIHWKAERQLSSGDWELLCDSIDYKKEGADVLQMEWIQNRKAYSFKGKAGRYKLSFYPGEAYEGEGKERRTSVTACTSVIVDVNSSFTDHTVRLNVNGRYDLSSGLNIPKDVLQGEFKIETVRYLDKPADPSVPGSQDSYVDSRDYVTLGTNADKGLVTAKQIGTAMVDVTSDLKTYIPGLSGGDKIRITIIIGESFSLTSTRMTMAVGQEATIYGVISTVNFPEGSTFQWSTQNNRDNQYIEITSDTDSEGVTVVAKTITPDRVPVILKLEWTDPSGVTQIATCEITVNDSTTPVTLDKTELQMQSDDTSGETLTVTNYVKDTNLVWITSDSEIAIAQPDPDYQSMAKIIPQGKTGVAYVTVMNKDNNQTAVCKVIVNQYMTELKIDKGEKFSAKLTDGQVLMKATCTPSNATSTGVNWTSSSTDVAEVEFNGMDCVVKLKKAGTTVIRVASTEQPAAFSVYAECILTVETVPLTGISLKESKLTLVAGDTYTVVPTLTPSNASNPVVSWETGNANIAKVDDKGVITAVSVGQTTITVSGGEAKPQTIIVDVLNKLNTIKFEETEVTVERGKTHELKVIFSPEADVNTKISFSSTNPDVVTVDDKGVITGVNDGMAMIIATAEELGTTGAITCLVTVKPPTVVVEDFSIDPDKMTLIVGQEQSIVPVYTPEDTTNKEVTYVSGDDGVATVSEEGLVSAVAPGFTIITCTDVASQKTAICQVTVENDANLSLSPKTRELVVGESFTIRKTVTPGTADRSAKWRSSNTGIATVNSSGRVTGKKVGTATITCTLTRYNISATCTVKVANKRTTLKLDKNSIRINIGQTYKLKKTVTTNSNTKPGVRFTSKNKKIATVGSTSGTIKGKKVGSTIITAKTTDKKATAKCRVTVIRRVTGLRMNKTYAVAYVGRTIKLKATVKPKKASIKKLKWSSSNSGVANVISNGTVTPLAEGETYITVKTTDGSNKTARCYVKVLEPVPISSIVVAQSNLTMKRGDKAKLSYTILPDNHSDKVQFASDNNRVAKVSKTGTVTAVGTGNANITITAASSGVVSTVAVNVVALNKSSVRMRQYDTETLVVHGTSDTVTWYSANNRIATVTGGKIVGRGVGTTYVYAYVNGCRMGCQVTVVSVNDKRR